MAHVVSDSGFEGNMDDSELASAPSIELARVSHPIEDVQGLSGEPGRVIIMRHGHRLDEMEPEWSLLAPRPWDPPLSQHGSQQANEAAASMLDSFKIDAVVSSPFLRCLHTAGAVLGSFNPSATLYTHWGLGEVSLRRECSRYMLH